MLNKLRYRIAANWHLMRWFRLGLGALVIFEAVKAGDLILGILGGFLLFQAVFNAGCCGAGPCYTIGNGGKNEEKNGEVVYEEIKDK